MPDLCPPRALPLLPVLVDAVAVVVTNIDVAGTGMEPPTDTEGEA